MARVATSLCLLWKPIKASPLSNPLEVTVEIKEQERMEKKASEINWVIENGTDKISPRWSNHPHQLLDTNLYR